jgi:hypothetical protein
VASRSASGETRFHVAEAREHTGATAADAIALYRQIRWWQKQADRAGAARRQLPGEGEAQHWIGRTFAAKKQRKAAIASVRCVDIRMARLVGRFAFAFTVF